MPDNAPKHPAKFSKEIIVELADIFKDHDTIFDPCGGVGYLGKIKEHGWRGYVIINEIQPRWAMQGYQNGCDECRVDDAQVLSWVPPGVKFKAITSSPVYGNRMSDHFNNKAIDPKTEMPYKYHTYHHYHGGGLDPENAGLYYFHQEKYQTINRNIVRRILEVLADGGTLAWNCSRFLKSGELVNVVQWYRDLFEKEFGLFLLEIRYVKTKRMKHGANADVRVDNEVILVYRKDPQK